MLIFTNDVEDETCTLCNPSVLTIAQAVLKWREASGLSQTELAVKADVSLSLVQKIEAGDHTNIRGKNLRKLAVALGKPEDALLNLRPTPPVENVSHGTQNEKGGTSEDAPPRYDVSGGLAVTLTTKAALRGKTPLQLLTVLLNTPDDKLDRILPPGYRLPAERHGGMRIAAKDLDEGGGGGKRK